MYGTKSNGRVFKKAIEEALSVLAHLNKYKFRDTSALVKWATAGFKSKSPVSFTWKKSELPQIVKTAVSELNKLSNKGINEAGGKSNTDEDNVVSDVRKGLKSIDEICIGCCKKTVHGVFPHPLFNGNVCNKCKIDIYKVCDGPSGRIKEECFVCGQGGTLVYCSNNLCSRSYCALCIEYLVSEKAYKEILKNDNWLCYVCEMDFDPECLIKRRNDHQGKTNVKPFQENQVKMESDEISPMPNASYSSDIAIRSNNCRNYSKDKVNPRKMFQRGDFVWAKMNYFPWWPALILNAEDCSRSSNNNNELWIYWFGDHKFTQIGKTKLKNFKDCFTKYTKKNIGNIFENAVEEVLNLLALSNELEFQDSSALLKWAASGFKSKSPVSFMWRKSELPEVVKETISKLIKAPKEEPIDNDGGNMEDDVKPFQENQVKMESDDISPVLQSPISFTWITPDAKPFQENQVKMESDDISPVPNASVSSDIAISSNNSRKYSKDKVNPPKIFQRGDFVWAKMKYFPWWPALILNAEDCSRSYSNNNELWIYWFGDHQFSQIEKAKLENFKDCFTKNTTKKIGNSFKNALEEVLNVLAVSNELEFQDSSALLTWAALGFKSQSPISFTWRKSELPEVIKATISKLVNAPKEEPVDNDGGDMEDDNAISDVRKGLKIIEEICIGCCKKDIPIIAPHPLFNGGICYTCKMDVDKTCDDPPGKMKEECIVCGQGGCLVYCSSKLCLRSYCKLCIEYLVSIKAYKKILENNNWLCYLCETDCEAECLLKKRNNYPIKISSFFDPPEPFILPVNNSANEKDPKVPKKSKCKMTGYVNIPPGKRRFLDFSFYLKNFKDYSEDAIEPLKTYQRGDFVWAKLTSYPWWPAMILNAEDCGRDASNKNKFWVFWFGDHKLSRIDDIKVANFMKYFTNKAMKNSEKKFEKGLKEILSHLAFSNGIKYQETSALLLWAYSEFEADMPITFAWTQPDLPSIVKTAIFELEEESDSDMDDDAVSDVRKGLKKIDDICIGCCKKNMKGILPHPLFYGGMCYLCQEDINKVHMDFNDAFFQVVCIVCGRGGTLVYCSNNYCLSSYCKLCIESLVSTEAYEKIIKNDHWLCYVCKTDHNVNCLIKRRNHCQPKIPILPAIPKHKRPITVISYTATGLKVLQKYKFKMNQYVKKSSNSVKCGFSSQAEIRKLSADLMLGSFFPPDYAMGNRRECSVLFFRFFYHFLNVLDITNIDKDVYYIFFAESSMLDENTFSRVMKFLRVYPLWVMFGQKKIAIWHNLSHKDFYQNLAFKNADEEKSVIEEIILSSLLNQLNDYFEKE